MNNKEYKQKWYLENKTRLAENNKKYRERNKELLEKKRKDKYNKNKSLILEQQVLWAQSQPERYILNRARSNARRKGFEFNLTLEDIQIPKTCPYLGIPLSSPRDTTNRDAVPSLDRIDTTKGYVKGNVQIISDKANRMKRDSSVDELLCFAYGILKIHA